MYCLYDYWEYNPKDSWGVDKPLWPGQRLPLVDVGGGATGCSFDGDLIEIRVDDSNAVFDLVVLDQ
jgi:hypothetical protein